MNNLSKYIAFSALLGSAAYGATVEAGRDLEDQDIRALKEWIQTKRQVSLKEIGGDLSISGEVRTEFQSAWETRNGKSQRGSGPLQLPGRGFDIEVNIMLDYRTDRAWASVKLEFDDDMGIFSGTLDKIALERAYFGVRPVSQDALTFDVELGRRPMSNVFDSRVQYGSFFDGLLLRYDQAFEKVGDFYARLGAFIINDRKDHFGYVGELGLLNIAGTGFYTKFSLIDWDTKTYSENFVNDRFRFLNTQGILGYRFRVESIKKIGIVYSGFLWNWAAKQLEVSDEKKAPWAFYVGMSMGQLLKQWDWAFDVNYQIVLAQALPDFDASGIGLGNADRSGFYTRRIRTLDGGGPSTRATAAGTTNYRGFSIQLDVLLTNNLDLQQSYVQSITYDSDIGPFRRYKQYELEFIYSW